VELFDMGIGAAAGAGAIGSAVGGAAALGGLAYTLIKGAPKMAAAPALPPSANPATLANAATSGAQQQKSKLAAGAAASGFDGTLTGGTPLSQGTPTTAKSSLLGG
jgi:hypothetical protein